MIADTELARLLDDGCPIAPPAEPPRCEECKGTGYHDRIDWWDVPCPACNETGVAPGGDA